MGRRFIGWAMGLVLGAAALAVASGGGSGGVDGLEPAVRGNQRGMPAGVQIVTEIDYEWRRVAYVESRIQPGVFLREVGEWERHQTQVAGSGTVVFSDAVHWGNEVRVMTLILTNHHVIQYALPEYRLQVMKQYRPEDVRWHNWRQELAPDAREVAEVRVLGARLGIVVVPDQNFWIPAQVEMYDPNMDVALVRVDRVAGVPWVPLGDSDAVRVGETLYMAGAPLGLPFQLTSGRLGQKDLDLTAQWRGLWRYEIPQAPGSSGSGLFNRDGELVAIARGSLGTAYFVGWERIFVPEPGQHLGVPANQIKFLLRWQGYGFVFDYDETDIVQRWTAKKVQ
ncbi:MAG: serine protease [Limnochordales bacterium]